MGRAQPPMPRLRHPWLDQDASRLPRTRASSHNQARENEFCPGLFHGLSGHLHSREHSHHGCQCSLWFWPPLPRGPIHKEVVLASGDPSGHSPYPPATVPCLLSQARVLLIFLASPTESNPQGLLVPGNQGLPKASTEGLSSSHWPPPPPTGGRGQRWAWLLPWRLGRSAGVGTSGMALGAVFRALGSRGATLPFPGLCVCVCVCRVDTEHLPGPGIPPPPTHGSPSTLCEMLSCGLQPPSPGEGWVGCSQRCIYFWPQCQAVKPLGAHC